MLNLCVIFLHDAGNEVSRSKANIFSRNHLHIHSPFVAFPDTQTCLRHRTFPCF